MLVFCLHIDYAYSSRVCTIANNMVFAVNVSRPLAAELGVCHLNGPLVVLDDYDGVAFQCRHYEHLHLVSEHYFSHDLRQCHVLRF